MYNIVCIRFFASLRQCTDAAIKKSKETKRGKQTRELNYFEPIMYVIYFFSGCLANNFNRF